VKQHLYTDQDRPEWWTPLPSVADIRIHRENPVTDRRLVVYLEFG